MHLKLSIAGLVALAAALFASHSHLTAQRRSFRRPSGLYVRSSGLGNQALMSRIARLERRVADLERLLDREVIPAPPLTPDLPDALRRLTAAKNRLAFSERSFRKGFISEAEFESSQFEFQRAQKRVAMARAADRPDELERLSHEIEILEAEEDLGLARRRLKYAKHIESQGFPDQAAVQIHQQLVEEAEARLKALGAPLAPVTPEPDPVPAPPDPDPTSAPPEPDPAPERSPPCDR